MTARRTTRPAAEAAEGIARLERYLDCRAELAAAEVRRRSFPAGPPRPTAAQADLFALRYAAGITRRRCRTVAGLLGLAALLLFVGAFLAGTVVLHAEG